MALTAVKPFQNRFEIPDEEIMEMLNACGRNILQAREIHDGVPVYQVGPTCYRGLWIADGLSMLEAAFILGTVRTVEDGLCALLRRVHPNGSIYAIPFHEKETAIALFTIIRQCSIAGDYDRLEELWPVIKRGVDFLKTRVESSCEYGEEYPASGLYPPSYGDGGINGLEPEYTTPLWIMAALKTAADVGRREGFDAWESMDARLQSMLTRYRKAYARDRKVTPEGAAYVKTSMLTEEQMEERIRNFSHYNLDGEVCNWGGYPPQCGTWALAQVISMGELFDENDRVVQDFLSLLDSCDDAEGIPQDTGWVTEGAIWGYSSMFYAQAFLYAGMPEKTVQYLYAFANHASGARCWREEQALAGTQCSAIWGDMPHNWGSAEFIRLVRCMLVHEKKNDLYLLDALPERWLPTAEKNICLENTPTRFGSVTMELSKIENGCCLAVSTAFHRDPDTIRVRIPKGFVADGKNPEGQYLLFDGREQITLTLQRRA